MAVSTDPHLVLAVCGGGNDVLAWIFGIGVAGVYAGALLAAVFRAEDGTEMAMGLGLLVASVAIGALFTFGGASFLGGDQLGAFVVSLLVCGGLAIGVAARWREEIVGRLIFLGVGGAAAIPAGFLLLLFAAFGIGSGCLA